MSHLTFPERLILGKLQPLPIENFIKYTDTTNGRDKLYRFVQYFARFLVAILKAKAPTHTTIISGLENLKANLGLARKLMRIGKPIEHFQALIKSLAQVDGVLRFFTITKCLGYMIYLTLDTLQWIHSCKIYTFNNVKSIGKFANRMWLLAIVSNLLANIYLIPILQPKINAITAVSDEKNEMDQALAQEKRNLIQRRNTVVKNIISNSLDALLPGSALGWVNPGEIVVGLAGSITSLMAAKDQFIKVSSK